MTTKKIAIVSATPAHLKQLAGNPAALEAFWQRGGTLVLCGLTPEGLADFNRIVGVEHVIRPFKRERVTFPPVRNPLTAGLTVGDIVMLSGQRIFGWTADEYVASDVFTYVVDLEDMAPFAKSDFASYRQYRQWFRRIGRLAADHRLSSIRRTASRYEIHLDLPAEETIVEYTHDQSINYNPTTRIALLFDGKDRVEFESGYEWRCADLCHRPAASRPTRHRATAVEWQSDPTKGPNIGIDNIALKVQRSAAVACDRQADAQPGRAGAVRQGQRRRRAVQRELPGERSGADQPDQEADDPGHRLAQPEGTVLRWTDRDRRRQSDLHAAWTSIPRRPRYKDERGWFGDANRTFKALPAGEHVLAGVHTTSTRCPPRRCPRC